MFKRTRDGKRIGKISRRLIVQTRSRSFRCVHCKTDVPTNAPGTAHRNHCAICLWSRHVDESIGDRKSGYLSSMKPVGLTLGDSNTELMIVHMRMGCSKTPKNRVAGDDNTCAILSLFEQSLRISPEDRKALKDADIELCDDKEEVLCTLYGKPCSF